jgi:hypothetical protein
VVEAGRGPELDELAGRQSCTCLEDDLYGSAAGGGGAPATNLRRTATDHKCPSVGEGSASVVTASAQAPHHVGGDAVNDLPLALVVAVPLLPVEGSHPSSISVESFPGQSRP